MEVSNPDAGQAVFPKGARNAALKLFFAAVLLPFQPIFALLHHRASFRRKQTLAVMRRRAIHGGLTAWTDVLRNHPTREEQNRQDDQKRTSTLNTGQHRSTSEIARIISYFGHHCFVLKSPSRIG
ncbi:MAG: hypothetical protein P8M78_08735 [Myxococcota bacterium]|nr:hypothetical protein [Myxococcota bacterium]